jgi:N-methylhydantoinase A
VTDANLLLGYLSDDSALAGGLRLDRDAAARVLDQLGRQLDLTAIETAAGIIEIANLEMLRATSSTTVARGIDPRDHALVAFGGAGPMHAAAIAEALEIGRVICPAACGVLSAFGIASAGRRRDRSRSVVRPLEELGEDEIARLVEELAADAARELGDDESPRDITTVYELRYAGQSFELPVEAATGELGAAFHQQHAARYGFNDPELPVELVTLRVSVATPGAGDFETRITTSGSAPRSTRTAWFADRELETTVLAGSLGNGESIAGPAVLEQPQATIVVPPGWIASGKDGDTTLNRQTRR